MGDLMMRVKLLEQIWCNRLELRPAHSISPLGRILTSLLALPLTHLVVRDPTANQVPFAMYAGEAIFSGATLADVLEEEFGLDLNDESIILVEGLPTAGTPDVSPEQLGKSVGNIIVSLARTESNKLFADVNRRSDAQETHAFNRAATHLADAGYHVH